MIIRKENNNRKSSISLHLLRRLWRGGFDRHRLCRDRRRRGRQCWREASEALGGLPKEARGVRIGGRRPDASRLAVVEVQRLRRARGRAIERRRALQRAAQCTEQRRLATLPRSLRANCCTKLYKAVNCCVLCSIVEATRIKPAIRYGQVQYLQ